MTLPKLQNITLDDIQKRPLVVIVALLLVLCGFLFTRLDRGASRELETQTARASDCEERYNRLLTQVLIYADIIQDYRSGIDSVRTKDEVQINKILK